MLMLRLTVASAAVLGLTAAGFSIHATASSPAAAPRPAAALAPSPYGLETGTPALRSAGALAWGPERILFIGDTVGGAVHAIDTPALPADSRADGLKIDDIDKKVAALLGTTADQITFRDMKTHRASQAVFLSVMNGRGPQATPALVRATRDGQLTRVPLTGVAHATLALTNAPDADAKTVWGANARTLSITSLGFVDGRVYVAGLSNEEFASDFRIAPFPFKGAAETTSVEIFHTSHDQYETQSPIMTFLPMLLKGTPSLLAGYTCAPLASFKLADLKPSTKVRGQTLAELGGGNRPLDMIAFPLAGEPIVLIANSHRTLMKLRTRDIEAQAPITKAVVGNYVSSGVPYVSVAQVGVLQLDDFNENWILLLQRDIETGALNLTTFPKKTLL